MFRPLKNISGNKFLSYRNFITPSLNKTQNKKANTLEKIIKNNTDVYNSFSVTQKKIFDSKTQLFHNYRTYLENMSMSKKSKNNLQEYKMTPFYEKLKRNNMLGLEIMEAYIETKKLTNISDKATEVVTNNVEDLDYSVVNMLIFGKTILRSINDVERILSYVRIKMTNEEKGLVFQLDHYIIKYGHFYDTLAEYDIDFVDEMTNLRFAKTDIEKFFCAKYIIQLMNEVDPQHLNFGNYIIINEWYLYNGLPIQKAHYGRTNYELYKNLWR